MSLFLPLIYLVLFAKASCRMLAAVFKGDWAVIFFAVLFLADSSIQHMFALWKERGRCWCFIGRGTVSVEGRHLPFLPFR